MKPEILAPAGSPESLIAAVRCGADAVYLGGRELNARRAAANFDGCALRDAVSYCHARGVKVYLTLNTLVFDSELGALEAAVREACVLGVDAVIVQDLAVAAFIRERAPSLELFASTQMSAHTPDGVKQLEDMGFSRVVLARELSKDEIIRIREQSHLPVECFVHGALCECVSGQCYFSALIGGRSGNRGLCAQPCRLPMRARGREYCLSLKDLSLIPKICEPAHAGVCSLKIEGRMKRPEYVAAAVTACRRALDGEAPDMDTLARVFSRTGFTSGWFDGKPGLSMFGSRRREDVTAASPALLAKLAATYKNEAQTIPVVLSLTLESEAPSSLEASDDRLCVRVEGDIPQQAEVSPLTAEKATVYLSKTGGTPFYASEVSARIKDGLTLPASALNALRRQALDKLLELRGKIGPHPYREVPLPEIRRYKPAKLPALRIRLSKAKQLTRELAGEAELISLPATELCKLDSKLLEGLADRLSAELPRVMFLGEREVFAALAFAQEKGITHAEAGNIGSLKTALDLGFSVHGGFSLNITNTPALNEYEKLGLQDAVLSIELSSRRISALGGNMPRGILAYGRIPWMITRSCPMGDCKNCEKPVITDRLGNRFPVICGFGAAEILNCVPLYLADRMGEFSGIDFYSLYFTEESPGQCLKVLEAYRTGDKTDVAKTRGLYFREVK